MRFLMISITMDTSLAAETHLADGEILQVSLNRKEFSKL
jgi:hypothetical protein